MSPSRRREAIEQVRRALPVSERRTCQVLGQHRSTQRHPPKDDADERRLTADIVALAKDYGRYGYRRIHALLGHAGWQVSLSVVERIWRREGLKVPKRQPKRRRLWLGDGSCIRLRPQHRGHVWSYDFVEDQTHNGRKFRMLNIIDEFSRECLAMVPLRRFRSNDVIDVLVQESTEDVLRFGGVEGGADKPYFTVPILRAVRRRVGWLMLLFLTAFEILVAFLQAYIFTILSAVYIGSSMEGHGDDHELDHGEFGVDAESLPTAHAPAH